MSRVHGSWLLLLLAILDFVLAAFGVGAGWPVQIVPIGLALFAASFFFWRDPA